MQKWNRDCFLKMNKKAKDFGSESGITLVELLAAISILTVVILLAGSIHLFAQRHFINQTDSASRSNDLSYALSVLSTDLRKAQSHMIRIEEDPMKLMIVDEEDSKKVLVTYEVVDNQLLKNKEVIADSISRMEVDKRGPTYEMTVTLHSDGEHSPNKTYSTTVTFRGVKDD